MAASDSLVLPTPLGNVDLAGDASMSSTDVVLPIVDAGAVLIDDINTVVDAILEWISEMRMSKRISVETRDEILIEIACVKINMQMVDQAARERWNREWFTELELNLARMQNGVFDTWYHGE